MSPAVVVTGPEDSGTRILHRVVQEFLGVREAIHLSVPHGGVWWDWEEHISAGARFVIIQRRPDITTLAIVARHPVTVSGLDEARRNWHAAIAMLARLPRATWLSYEAFVADPKRQARNVGRWLASQGVPIEYGTMPEIVDANARWLTIVER